MFCSGCLLARISWDLNPDQLLDRSQIIEFGPGTKRDRDPLRAGAAGTADSMHVGFWFAGRQIVVDHMRDAVDIDSTRGNVGGDQYPHLIATKCVEARCREFCDLLPWITAD